MINRTSFLATGGAGFEIARRLRAHALATSDDGEEYPAAEPGTPSERTGAGEPHGAFPLRLRKTRRRRRETRPWSGVAGNETSTATPPGQTPPPGQTDSNTSIFPTGGRSVKTDSAIGSEYGADPHRPFGGDADIWSVTDACHGRRSRIHAPKIGGLRALSFYRRGFRTSSPRRFKRSMGCGARYPLPARAGTGFRLTRFAPEEPARRGFRTEGKGIGRGAATTYH